VINLPLINQGAAAMVREALARNAIKRSLGTEAGKDGIDLFIDHHLEELSESYWLEYFGTARPEASTIIEALILKYSDEDDEVEMLDFTLPGDVTNYVVCVRLEPNGEVHVSMES